MAHNVTNNFAQPHTPAPTFSSQTPLHVHNAGHFDGECTVRSVLTLAQELGVAGFAQTSHNNPGFAAI